MLWKLLIILFGVSLSVNLACILSNGEINIQNQQVKHEPAEPAEFIQNEKFGSIEQEVVPSPPNDVMIDTGKQKQDEIDSSYPGNTESEIKITEVKSLETEQPTANSDMSESEEDKDSSTPVSGTLEPSQLDVSIQSVNVIATPVESITKEDLTQEVTKDVIHNTRESLQLPDETPVLSEDVIVSDIRLITDSIQSTTISDVVPSPTPFSSSPEKSAEVIQLQDETEPVKQEEDFPSFTEWTQKVLAEEEKTKQESQSTEQSVTSKQKKLRNNYASNSCGAKILAANPEAENVQHVLTANKDEYMINPCSSKKWFLVELCEPVQVKMIEMASLELFSSQPKTFRVSISDRYPAKEWSSLGVYEAQDERSVQYFQASNDQFVKYVRFELIEHYGNEHFCPLTVFRLFGLPIADDDDNDETNSQTETDIETVVREEDSKDGAKTLFTSAKDTVVNLVKKVLNVNNDKIETEEQIGNTTELWEDKNISSDGIILPCVPDISHLNSNVIDLPTVLVPTPTVREITVDSGSEFPIVTKLDDDEQIESGEMSIAIPNVQTCLNISHKKSSQKVLCSYIQTMLDFASRDMCKKDEYLFSSEMVTESIEIEVTENQNLITNTDNEPVSSDRIVSVIPTSEIKPEDKSFLPSTLDSTAMSNDSSREISESSSPHVENMASNTESKISKDFDSTTQIILEPSETLNLNNGQSDVSADKLDATQTTSNTFNFVEKTQMDSTPSEIQQPETSQVYPDVILPSIQVSKTQETLISSDQVKDLPSSGRKPRDLELVRVPLGSIAKRETAIMRLTNRIKALELNVSLSSRFLQELSQRFKKQNEEIMKLMNKTIARLNNTTRESELLDQTHQGQLDVLETKMDNLTSVIDRLAQNMETLSNKISDRQIVWSSVEFVMLMIVCIVCLMRGRPASINPELKQLLEAMPKKPNLTTAQRRNSDVGSAGHTLPLNPIRKNISLTALADQALCDTNNLSSTDSRLVKDGSRKKKKRKKSFQSKSSTFVMETETNQSPVQISRQAGILFGADAGTTLSGVGIQEVDHGPVSHSSSSSTVSLPSQCHKRTLSDDMKTNTNHNYQQTENKKYNPTQKISHSGRGNNKNKKQNRLSAHGSDVQIESMKPIHCKIMTNDKDEVIKMNPSTISESRHKSRVSWLF